MRIHTHFIISALAVSLSLVATVRGQDKKADAPAPKKEESKKEPKDETVTTQHEATIGGEKILYSATAGTLVLKEEDGKPRASFFYVAYSLSDTNSTNNSNRPLTFSFNGGPGSSSIWLHMGALGPKRVQMREPGILPAPPYRVVGNEFSILDKTDLVFIDPISTGFSRAVPGEDPRRFHGIDEDVESVGEFIRLYVTRAKRWDSPKFVIGESYGTTRAAALANYLQTRFGMYLNGVMLVSVVLDFQTISFVPGNDLPFILFLPSYAATALYHQKIPGTAADLDAVINRAKEFAAGPYAAALFKGNKLTETEKGNMAEEISRLTGLSSNFVSKANLRVEAGSFFKELLREEGRTVGRFDSRLLGVDRHGVGDSPDYDPSYTAVLGPFSSSFNHYVREELNFESDLPYETLTGKVRPWNYGRFNNQYVNVSESLRQAQVHNPYLKVFVANGIYDLATPFFAAEHTVDHLGTPREDQFPHIKEPFVFYYEAGHMMYTHLPSLAKFKKDLGRFIDLSRNVPASEEAQNDNNR
ncbi:MAG: S10 family peptidase [Verrucomicrobiales bacterium]